MEYYGVGRVTPGYEINDNPATGGRSVGYGADSIHPSEAQRVMKTLRFGAIGPSEATSVMEDLNQPTVHYGASFTSWVQEDPGSLKLHPLPPEGKVSPDFTQGRMVGYGADLPGFITKYYPGFLKREVGLPVVGTMMLGTIILAVLGTYLALRVRK